MTQQKKRLRLLLDGPFLFALDSYELYVMFPLLLSDGPRSVKPASPTATTTTTTTTSAVLLALLLPATPTSRWQPDDLDGKSKPRHETNTLDVPHSLQLRLHSTSSAPREPAFSPTPPECTPQCKSTKPYGRSALCSPCFFILFFYCSTSASRRS